MKKILSYFSIFEWCLWLSSVVLMIVFFIVFHNNQYLFLITSITGVTSLIFLSKGNVIGLIMSAIFSIAYAIIAIFMKYYSELITYAFMTLPITIISIFQWFKNPYKGAKTEVEIVEIPAKRYINIFAAGIVITILFYFIMSWLNTPHILFSTLSIFTSFIASYLSLLRSRFYAIAYALNDIILIILWSLACVDDLSYLAIVLCFVAFLANDTYGFINLTKLYKKQKEGKNYD